MNGLNLNLEQFTESGDVVAVAHTESQEAVLVEMATHLTMLVLDLEMVEMVEMVLLQ